MKKYFSLFTVLILLVISLSDCARRGSPKGGPKDEDAPVLVNAKPMHLATNFKAKEIKIYFDEYVKLKDLQKQLIISPPLKYQPIIKPLGTPSKYISIKILDTLKENTTYTFNFGQSVIDNTESNALNNFKYVFSTGEVIDSLKISGIIRDSFEKKADKNVTVMLYEVNDAFSDSAIYKEKPLYVASTLDSIAWEITNIKAGKYLLLALNDKSKNYKFNPKEDKIGFVKEYVNIPTDTTYIIDLFKEELPFKLTRPVEASKGHIFFGYEGVADSLKVETINESEKFLSVSNFEKDKDSLNFWYKDNFKDSIEFKVSNNGLVDTIVVKLRSKLVDSLQLTSSTRGTLHLRDEFKLLSKTPIQSIDNSKINFIGRDSAQIIHNFKISKDKMELLLSFPKEFSKRYTLELLPSGITDFFGNVNDTLNFNLITKKTTDYGSMFLTLQNIKAYPIIFQLITEKGELIEEVYAEKEQVYNFLNLVPDKYLVRIIYDENKNRQWDTGSFLLKKHPEEVLYLDYLFNVRANWELTETFILK